MQTTVLYWTKKKIYLTYSNLMITTMEATTIQPNIVHCPFSSSSSSSSSSHPSHLFQLATHLPTLLIPFPFQFFEISSIFSWFKNLHIHIPQSLSTHNPFIFIHLPLYPIALHPPPLLTWLSGATWFSSLALSLSPSPKLSRVVMPPLLKINTSLFSCLVS